MSKDKITFDIYCKRCRSDDLEVEQPERRSSKVTCNSCGAFLGTWGQVEDAAVEEVEDMIEKKFKDIFR